MRSTAFALIALFSAGVAHAEEPAKLTWEYSGYGKLPEAAAAAKKAGRRLLIGLPGAGT